MIKISVKKIRDNAIIPSYAHEGDAGLDLFATEDYLLKSQERHLFKLGISIQFENGYVGLIWDRSSMAYKYGIKSMGGVGDSGYRGEYGVILFNTSDKDYFIKKGDKIAQLLIQPVMKVQVEEVNILSETIRNFGGFGSTGR